MFDEIDKLKARLKREKTARLEAERILEQKSVELYQSNVELKSLTSELESRVIERTLELQKAHDKALKLAEVKSEFLANMSHELRTPLNGVLGMLTILKTTELNSRQDKLIDTAVNSGELLLALINDVLDLSKLENNKLELESIPFDPAEIIQLTCEPFVNVAASKGVELIYLIQPGIPNLINGDPTRIKQIVTNLVSNAIKFTAEGEILVSAFVEDDELVMSVSDTGIGMTPTQLDKVLDKFSQANESTTRKFGGTGLGLAICQKLVDIMSGLLSIDSQYEVGSNFEIRLPTKVIEHKSPAQQNPLPKNDNSTISKSSLIAFKNHHIVHYIKSLLKYWGFSELVSVSEIRDVASQMQSRSFDYVIIDHDFLNYPTLQANFKDNTPAFRLIVFQHAHNLIESNDSEVFSELSGMHHLLTLPIKQSDLFDALHNQRPQSSEVTLAKEALQQFTGCEVLLVEDNEVNQQVAEELLGLLDCTVTIAANGLEALATLNLQKFDLVLMDIQMPVMDGLEAARRIRTSTKPYSQIPIIALTAHSLQGDREKSLAAGMNDHITKPIELNELSRILEQYANDKLTEDTVSNEPSLVIDKRYTGLDAQEALTRVRFNVPFYIRVMQQFIEHTKKNLIQIANATKSNDLTTVQSIAHTIKGSSANIGANAVKEVATHLESGIKNRDLNNSEVQSLFEKLSKECISVFNSISQFIADNNETNQTITMSNEEIISTCDSIKQSLFSDISQADTLIQRMESTQHPILARSLTELREGYQSFNFSKIEAMCDRIINEVNHGK